MGSIIPRETDLGNLKKTAKHEPEGTSQQAVFFLGFCSSAHPHRQLEEYKVLKQHLVLNKH